MDLSSRPQRDEVAARGVERMRTGRDFRRAYRHGRRVHGDIAVLHVCANDLGRARLGLTASRRVGGAVVRNRLRRRVREHFRQQVDHQRLPAADIVVHLKQAAAAEGRRAFHRELAELFAAAAGRGRRRSRRRRRR